MGKITSSSTIYILSAVPIVPLCHTNARNTSLDNFTAVSIDIVSWIREQYVDPIIYDTGYNPVNTITWAIILGISIYCLIRLFRHLGLKVDERLVIYTLPYILAGSSLRVIEDAELLSPPWKYLLITPLIYFLVFAITIAALLITRKLLGRDFYRGYAAVGILWTAINLGALATVGFKEPWVIAVIFALGSAMAGGIYHLRRAVPWLCFLDSRFNLAILYAHMLDASSTYVGVDWFGYYEKHVVPTFLIDLTGTAAIMYPLKLLIILPVLSMIDGSIKDPTFRNLIKLVLIVLGLAPAVRNTLRLALGI
jgi:uncharacterized membrane protein